MNFVSTLTNGPAKRDILYVINDYLLYYELCTIYYKL